MKSYIQIKACTGVLLECRDKQTPLWSNNEKGEPHSAAVKMSKLLMCLGTSVAESQHALKKPALQGYTPHALTDAILKKAKPQDDEQASVPAWEGGAFEVSGILCPD